MDNLNKNLIKTYIKSEFGTYAKLAKILGLSEGTVKNAISKDDNVSWLNLLKHYAKKHQLRKSFHENLSKNKDNKECISLEEVNYINIFPCTKTYEIFKTYAENGDSNCHRIRPRYAQVLVKNNNSICEGCVYSCLSNNT